MRARQASSRPIEVRERILDAALQTFAEKGFDGATTRQIAGRANVPLGLLRYYFGDKLKLWQAAVDQAFGEIRSGLDVATFNPRSNPSFNPKSNPKSNPGSNPNSAAEGSDPLAAIRAGIRAHVRFVAKNPEFVRLMHDEGKRRGPRMRWLVDRHVKPLFERLVPVIAHLQELGRLPKDIAPLHFAYALIGAIDVIFHQAEECRRVTGVDPSDPAAVEAHSRAVEFMLLGSALDSLPDPPDEAAS
jgi:AcrR family transcriptional regulator